MCSFDSGVYILFARHCCASHKFGWSCGVIQFIACTRACRAWFTANEDRGINGCGVHWLSSLAKPLGANGLTRFGWLQRMQDLPLNLSIIINKWYE